MEPPSTCHDKGQAAGCSSSFDHAPGSCTAEHHHGSVCVVDGYSQAESQLYLQMAAQQNSCQQRSSYPQCFQPCSKHRPRCPRCECQCQRSPSYKIHVCKTAGGRYHHRTPPSSPRTTTAFCSGEVCPSVQWRRHMRKAWTHRR